MKMSDVSGGLLISPAGSNVTYSAQTGPWPNVPVLRVDQYILAGNYSIVGLGVSFVLNYNLLQGVYYLVPDPTWAIQFSGNVPIGDYTFRAVGSGSGN
jgi:hypothetical protein